MFRLFPTRRTETSPAQSRRRFRPEPDGLETRDVPSALALAGTSRSVAIPGITAGSMRGFASGALANTNFFTPTIKSGVTNLLGKASASTANVLTATNLGGFTGTTTAASALNFANVATAATNLGLTSASGALNNASGLTNATTLINPVGNVLNHQTAANTGLLYSALNNANTGLAFSTFGNSAAGPAFTSLAGLTFNSSNLTNGLGAASALTSPPTTTTTLVNTGSASVPVTTTSTTLATNTGTTTVGTTTTNTGTTATVNSGLGSGTLTVGSGFLGLSSGAGMTGFNPYTM
jgi:hypothetical protein